MWIKSNFCSILFNRYTFWGIWVEFVRNWSFSLHWLDPNLTTKLKIGALKMQSFRRKSVIDLHRRQEILTSEQKNSDIQVIVVGNLAEDLMLVVISVFCSSWGSLLANRSTLFFGPFFIERTSILLSFVLRALLCCLIIAFWRIFRQRGNFLVMPWFWWISLSLSLRIHVRVRAVCISILPSIQFVFLFPLFLRIWEWKLVILVTSCALLGENFMIWSFISYPPHPCLRSLFGWKENGREKKYWITLFLDFQILKSSSQSSQIIVLGSIEVVVSGSSVCDFSGHKWREIRI